MRQTLFALSVCFSCVSGGCDTVLQTKMQPPTNTNDKKGKQTEKYLTVSEICFSLLFLLTSSVFSTWNPVAWLPHHGQTSRAGLSRCCTQHGPQSYFDESCGWVRGVGWAWVAALASRWSWISLVQEAVGGCRAWTTDRPPWAPNQRAPAMGGIITDTQLPPSGKLKEEERLVQSFWRS